VRLCLVGYECKPRTSSASLNCLVQMYKSLGHWQSPVALLLAAWQTDARARPRVSPHGPRKTETSLVLRLAQGHFDEITAKWASLWSGGSVGREKEGEGAVWTSGQQEETANVTGHAVWLCAFWCATLDAKDVGGTETGAFRCLCLLSYTHKRSDDTPRTDQATIRALAGGELSTMYVWPPGARFAPMLYSFRRKACAHMCTRPCRQT